MRLTFQLVDSEHVGPPYCGWALSNQLKAQLEQKDRLLHVKRNSLIDCFQTGTAPLALQGSNLQAHVADSGIASIYIHVSSFLITNLSYTHTYTHAYTFCLFCFFGELCLIQIVF